MDQQEIDGYVKHMLSEKGIVNRKIKIFKDQYTHPIPFYCIQKKSTLWKKIKLFFSHER